MPRWPRKTTDERFDEKWILDPVTGCHIWIAGKGKAGYGLFKPTGKPTVTAHKYAYVRKHGSVPAGRELDHFRCDTPACCNPDHVRPVTHRENMLRGNTIGALNMGKSMCPWQHPLDGRTKYGRRYCKTCARNRDRRKRRGAA
jgi:HNH endonuclease